MMTAPELSAIEARCNAATAGPWGVDGPQGTRVHADGCFDSVCTMQLSNCPNWRNDRDFIADARTSVPALCAEVRRLRAIVDTPELHDFATAVVREAAHARERWGAGHDAHKTPQEWVGVLVYLTGKAITAAWEGNTGKLLHHIVTSAGLLANWHRDTVVAMQQKTKGE